MESKHLVGGLGMTTTGEQVTVIVYPYRLPKRLKPLTECILETQKNFGKGAVGTVLLLCIDPKSKFELVCHNGLRVVIVPPNHPLFRETLETMPRLCGFVHLVMPRCTIWLPVSRRPRFSPTLSTSVRTITASGARASVTRQTKFSHTSLLSCPPTPNSIASSLFLLIEEVFS